MGLYIKWVRERRAGTGPTATRRRCLWWYTSRWLSLAMAVKTINIYPLRWATYMFMCVSLYIARFGPTAHKLLLFGAQQLFLLPYFWCSRQLLNWMHRGKSINFTTGANSWPEHVFSVLGTMKYWQKASRCWRGLSQLFTCKDEIGWQWLLKNFIKNLPVAINYLRCLILAICRSQDSSSARKLGHGRGIFLIAISQSETAPLSAGRRIPSPPMIDFYVCEWVRWFCCRLRASSNDPPPFYFCVIFLLV